MKRKRRFEGKLGEIIGEMFEMPSAAVYGGVSLTLTDGREVYVTGCRAILSYSGEYIEVETGLGKIGIVGEELDISNYTDSEITVRGAIKSVSMQEDDKC